ncbi:hypothetical protein MKK75_00595 [Methylobacterium sp. J-030]|uniref:hypothetical protein n=1 Tax=Methylobacterium sp. J-030 TaxID=2836627 RepID=UPI001FB8839B|nr:hypothetical protein [Methylobacterium sp. J-030]MCJ2067319.1 hypothetical protein [Methylobacterium sp. J-030]
MAGESKAAAAAPSPVGSQSGGGMAVWAGAGSGGGAKPPFDWADIGPGSLVLAQGDDEDAYYAATLAAHGGRCRCRGLAVACHGY